MLIFGSHLKTYRNFYAALSSAFRFSLGQFELKQMQHATYLFGSIYFILFILIVIMGLMSMFITILNEAFEKCKHELATKKNEYEFVQYFQEKWHSLRSGFIHKNKANSNRIEALVLNNGVFRIFIFYIRYLSNIVSFRNQVYLNIDISYYYVM